MKTYNTGKYNNYKGKKVSQQVLILDDNERSILAKRIVQLVDKINNENIPINHHDGEIIIFLFKVLHFHHKGEMMDIMRTQLTKIDRMVMKVYNMSFLEWFEELDYEGTIDSSSEMHKWMSRKRQLEQEYQNKELVTLKKQEVKNAMVNSVFQFT